MAASSHARVAIGGRGWSSKDLPRVGRSEGKSRVFMLEGGSSSVKGAVLNTFSHPPCVQLPNPEPNGE